jgi:hypothetical protein
MVNWKGCERKQSFPKSKQVYYPRIPLERLKKTMKLLSQDKWCHSQDSNQPSHEGRMEELKAKPT